MFKIFSAVARCAESLRPEADMRHVWQVESRFAQFYVNSVSVRNFSHLPDMKGSRRETYYDFENVFVAFEDCFVRFWSFLRVWGRMNFFCWKEEEEGAM